MAAAPPFTLDISFIAGGCGRAAPPCAPQLRRLSGRGLSELLAAKQRRYAADVEATFGLGALSLRGETRDAPLPEPTQAFARATLGAALGSVGYFYGTSLVSAADGLAARETEAAALTALVPSRAFFPRGFLWDEGAPRSPRPRAEGGGGRAAMQPSSAWVERLPRPMASS